MFRSGYCYRRGKGRIFPFRPGHETFPIYEQPDVLDLIANAIDWAASTEGGTVRTGQSEPLEEIE